MALQFAYQKIIKYAVTARCTQPLHIGSAAGGAEEVLVHPVDEKPFIQASSIAGVFRSSFGQSYPLEETDLLFGAGQLGEGSNASDYGSRIRFSDGQFEEKEHPVRLELRPRVRIDAASGSVGASRVKGTSKSAGHKFETMYIGAGAEFTFQVYLYDPVYQQKLEELFAEMKQEQIQFGGQKSNGCGYIGLVRLLRTSFDMTDAGERKRWAGEDSLPESAYEDITGRLKTGGRYREAYEISVRAKTEGVLLVKSAVVPDYGADAPDSMNMRNADLEYIVPGSSLKGALRSRMEMIASYLQDPTVIPNTFGGIREENQTGKTGNLVVLDTIVGNREENDRMPLSHRIHVDKFTGGVIHGGLFTEKNVAGEMELRIRILDKNEPDKTCGLLLLALRDLAVGTMNIGGGYSTGKGILKVSEICIRRHVDGEQALVDFSANRVVKGQELIDQCVGALQ